jgi:hypothetical protein
VSYSANGTTVTFGIRAPMLLSLDLFEEQSLVTKGMAWLLGMKPWHTRFRSPLSLSRPGEPQCSGTGILEYYELR